MVEKCGNSKIICTGALDKENIYGNLYSELATVLLAWLRNNPKIRIFVVSHDREPESHSQTGPPVSDTKKNHTLSRVSIVYTVGVIGAVIVSSQHPHGPLFHILPESPKSRHILASTNNSPTFSSAKFLIIFSEPVSVAHLEDDCLASCIFLQDAT